MRITDYIQNTVKCSQAAKTFPAETETIIHISLNPLFIGWLHPFLQIIERATVFTVEIILSLQLGPKSITVDYCDRLAKNIIR